MVLSGHKFTSFGLFKKIKPLLTISRPKLTPDQQILMKQSDYHKKNPYEKSQFEEWIIVY